MSLATLAKVTQPERAEAEVIVYQVRPGDTPASLSKRFGRKTEELGITGNPADPHAIYVGQFLIFATQSVAKAPPPAKPVPPSVVAIATRYLGYPYVWGGTSPAGFDCSGFTWFVYRQAGHPIPRDLWGQLDSGARVARSALQPGDLVFFANTYEEGLSHGGVYLGGNRFIHAEDYGKGVVVSNLSGYWGAAYYAACRPRR